MIGASCSPSHAICLNSDYAGHRLTFQLFAQSPPFAHLAAVYRNFNWTDSLRGTKEAAGLSDHIYGSKQTAAECPPQWPTISAMPADLN